MAYNRYSTMIKNGKFKIMPLAKLSVKKTDYYEVYRRGRTRMDLLSSQYYNDPNYDWLIMLANRQYGSMEFAIPEGSIIRIPYPLEQSLEDYYNKLSEYKKQYGLE